MKSTINKICMTLPAISFSLTLIITFISIIFNLDFYYNGIKGVNIVQISFLTFCVSVILNYVINSKSKIMFIISCVLLVLTLCFTLFKQGFKAKDITYISPNNSNSIIINEYQWMMGAGGNIYYRENSFFIKQLESFTTASGYHPFSMNESTVKWIDENTVKIKFKASKDGSFVEKTYCLN